MATKTKTVKRDYETIELPTIEVWDTIPDFQSEREEADFWATHGLGQSILDQEWEEDPRMPARGTPRRARPTSVRFDGSTVSRLKALAAARGKGYQTLLKEFVMERLYEEEKREGIIPR